MTGRYENFTKIERMKQPGSKWLVISLSFSVILNSGNSFAGSGDQFDYPELSVVPRASERLATEAQKEPDRKMTTFLPVQGASLVTLVAGFMSFDPQAPGPGLAGIGVGGGWLLLSTYLAMTYRPYTSGLATVSAMPKGTTREQLTRERAAEEVIKGAGHAGRRLNWLFLLSNFGAAGYMVAMSGKSPAAPVSQFGTVLQMASILTSFLPVVFSYHWGDVEDEQAEYKKRIYGPIAQPTLLFDRGTQSYTPGMAVSLRF